MVHDIHGTIERYFARGLRLDGRQGLEAYRDVSVQYGVSKNAEGSARVRIGQTVVLAGVKMAVDTPYPDTPDKGNLMVNAELTPLSSPEFEAGPPSDWAIEIARVVDRALREGEALDLRKLVIEPGEKVWTVIIDIVPVNDGGNLLDAASLAALAALHDARFPHVTDGQVDYHRRTDEPLPLQAKPLLTTVYKIGDFLFLDPDYEEEHAVEGRLSVGVLEDGTLCALQKGLPAGFKEEEVLKAVELARTAADFLRQFITQQDTGKGKTSPGE